MEIRQYDQLPVLIAESDAELGEAAAAEFAEAVRAGLAEREEIAIIMSLGAAQDSFFAALIARDDIEWSRITVFHVDTYIGVGNDRFESGAVRLRENLLDHVGPKQFFPMVGDHEPIEEEIARYSELIERHDPEVCVVGIGWTGHLAFNDPPTDFNDHALVKAVALAETSRRQILEVGYFKTIESVPEYGLTLSMTALLRPRKVLALVHQKEKAAVIKRMLEEPVTIMCPASYLTTQSHARLYLSPNAASELTPQ